MDFKKEAEEYVKQNYCEMCIMSDDCKSGCIDCFTVQAYLAGAKPRKKRIAELESQIEKMKCCEMCKYKKLDWGFSPICEVNDKIKINNPFTCKCDKWEIWK